VVHRHRVHVTKDPHATGLDGRGELHRLLPGTLVLDRQRPRDRSYAHNSHAHAAHAAHAYAAYAYRRRAYTAWRRAPGGYWSIRATQRSGHTRRGPGKGRPGREGLRNTKLGLECLVEFAWIDTAVGHYSRSNTVGGDDGGQHQGTRQASGDH